MRSLPTYIIMTVLAAVCCIGLSAQQRTRIPGLENNAEYLRLVSQEERLSQRSDSLSRAMDDIRRSFRTDTLNRATNSAAILRMEEESFDIRNRMARLAGQINAIEQEWILRSLDPDGQPGGNAAPAAGTGERTFANLVYNSYFKLNLPPEDLRDLRHAQELELSVPPLVEEYRENNDRLLVLKYAYDLSVMAGTADTIRMRFDSLARTNAGIEREIAQTWETIFDNKSYSYNLLMDKNNRSDLLLLYENDMENLRLQQAELHGVYASDEITKYVLQKRMLTGYEVMLAEDLANSAAFDSLKKVQAALPFVDRLGLTPVALKERLFLDYADIKVNPSPPYNSHNPIPTVEVYPKGIIYRVLLGTFSGVQQPSAFRNISPLAVQKGPDNKYRYFAGGFPSDSTVKAAVEQMKRLGFRNPEPVVWMDGVYINLAYGKGLGSGFFRVELSGVHELPQEVRAVIRTVTGGKDILKGDGVFIVGPLDDATEAARLRSALEGLDPDIGIKITEIPE